MIEWSISLCLELVYYIRSMFFFFFFQAEDGIRDYKVTGVQTCALPILSRAAAAASFSSARHGAPAAHPSSLSREAKSPGIDFSTNARWRSSFFCAEIGRASCRERV